MKHFSLRILVGIITFFVGISVVIFWYFRPHSQSSTDAPISAPTQSISSESKSAWNTLLSFENQDLQKLDRESKDKLEQAEKALIGNHIEQSKLISKISNSQRQIRYVFIQVSSLMTIPGGSSLRVFIFNNEGELLNSLAFPSGWRIDVKDIRVVYKPEIGREVIEVESKPVINGRDIVKQYYCAHR